ncbi:Nudix hydrolase 16 [Morus notabilis]|uniref:Nudix hydrolase 16 n=1 Tax=Morus notabilis TaxID=981085 RepID=W9QJ07_9ROSA|nr:Nudix hydrolase 16 [Morus notabilis]
MSDSELVARTGRQLQRYQDGCRLVAGYRNHIKDDRGAYENVVEVLMINSTSGPNLVFPKLTFMLHIPIESAFWPEKMSELLAISSEFLNVAKPLLIPYPDNGLHGGWENDETVEQAAVREAVEEAGVRGDLVVIVAVVATYNARLLFFQHFLGYYCFKSKTLQDEFCPEGLCKAAMFVLLVKEELQFWPEQSTRQRSWLTIPEAMERCRHQWMRKALEEGFLKWQEDQMMATSPKEENHLVSSALSPDQD